MYGTTRGARNSACLSPPGEVSLGGLFFFSMEWTKKCLSIPREAEKYSLFLEAAKRYRKRYENNQSRGKKEEHEKCILS